MKYLRQAMFNGLSRLFTADKVYQGIAPRGVAADPKAMPYHTFTVSASLRNLSTTNREATHWDAKITVHSIGIDQDEIDTHMRQIHDMMCSWEPDAIPSGQIVFINPGDNDLSVEPQRDGDADLIWHGVQIFDGYLILGRVLSSSSSSSSSSQTASSASSSDSSSTASSSSSSTCSSSSSSTASSSSSSSSSTSSYSSESSSSSSSSGP